MKVSLIGIQDINFTTGKNEVIDGVKLHYAKPDDNTYGQKVDSRFVGRNVFNSFEFPVQELVELIGTVIDVEFDDQKKICGIRV